MFLVRNAGFNIFGVNFFDVSKFLFFVEIEIAFQVYLCSKK